MPHRLLVFFVLLVFSGCSPLLTEPPPVSDSTMVEVLTELHLAEALQHAASPPLPPSIRDSILERHQLTPASFEAALEYYALDAEEYAALFERVLERLNAERTQLGDYPKSVPNATSSEAPTAP